MLVRKIREAFGRIGLSESAATLEREMAEFDRRIAEAKQKHRAADYLKKAKYARVHALLAQSLKPKE